MSAGTPTRWPWQSSAADDSHPADRWIAETVRGKSFVDVGGLWGTVNEKITVAHASGASRVVMLDITPPRSELWDRFLERCEERGVPHVDCTSADVHTYPSAVDACRYDVVHCSGILYHVPDPSRTLRSLAAMARETLILASAVVPEKILTRHGVLSLRAGSALHVPGMSASDRRIAAAHFEGVGASTMIGLNSDCAWDVDDYAPWRWLFTTEYIHALIRDAGLRVLDSADHWQGRVAYFRAAPY